ncbi:MAG: hypothetical protein GTO71_07890, partial [Woeseiaceae bacterium]|nr:hypothetical protein [Woeseiaceae bacterium]NIP21007.1 hypothetical protein [Woeseiaceae bacterium]
QEAAVHASRAALLETLAIGDLELVDPLAPDRKVGKTYIYRSGDGWEVSGYYRRGESKAWHPYLISLDASLAMTHLRVRDNALLDAAADNPVVEVVP